MLFKPGQRHQVRDAVRTWTARWAKTFATMSTPTATSVIMMVFVSQVGVIWQRLSPFESLFLQTRILRLFNGCQLPKGVSLRGLRWPTSLPILWLSLCAWNHSEDRELFWMCHGKQGGGPPAAADRSSRTHGVQNGESRQPGCPGLHQWICCTLWQGRWARRLLGKLAWLYNRVITKCPKCTILPRGENNIWIVETE